jgi:hypothetical protein
VLLEELVLVLVLVSVSSEQATPLSVHAKANARRCRVSIPPLYDNTPQEAL